MSLLYTGVILMLVATGMMFYRKCTHVVGEDEVAVTVNRDGFIKRLLPAGRHWLYPTERVELALSTKTRLVSGRAAGIATGDGVMVQIHWSGTYALRPELITENRSQRLRSLPRAEQAIARKVDIGLRKLAGNYRLANLFSPEGREQLERRLSYLLADELRSLGIVFNRLNLQTIDLPAEVTDALNKAKALETLDTMIRRLDPTTREVMRGAYQLDEMVYWDSYLPVPTRLSMKHRLEAAGPAR